MTKQEAHEKAKSEAQAQSLLFPQNSYAVSINGGWTTRFKGGELIFEGWEWS